jgi:pyruvate dehydrogenase E1 component alpha subunit
MRACLRLLEKRVVPLTPDVPSALYDPGKVAVAPLPTTATIDTEEMKKSLELMLRIRRMETLCDQAYKNKKIRGFCHLYIGQEAIPAGMENILNFNDCIVTGYRDHGWHISRGGTPYEVFAEMFGHQGGCSKGKGGSMHMYNVKNNFYGGNGIVGAQVPLGAGLAWRFALENRDAPKNVAVAFYGDGAANQGQIFEAMNIAALQKIPIIFACENNQFGMGTSKKRASFESDFYKRGGYIPGIKVDGMNMLAVQEGTRWAKEHCTSGKGPVVIEFDSYRYMGHSMSDPDSQYRSKSDIQNVRNTRDCIAQMKKFVVEQKILNDDEISQMEKTIKKEVDKDLLEATNGANTDMKELYRDILIGEQFPIRTCQGSVWAKVE